MVSASVRAYREGEQTLPRQGAGLTLDGQQGQVLPILGQQDPAQTGAGGAFQASFGIGLQDLGLPALEEAGREGSQRRAVA